MLVQPAERADQRLQLSDAVAGLALRLLHLLAELADLLLERRQQRPQLFLAALGKTLRLLFQNLAGQSLELVGQRLLGRLQQRQFFRQTLPLTPQLGLQLADPRRGEALRFGLGLQLHPEPIPLGRHLPDRLFPLGRQRLKASSRRRLGLRLRQFAPDACQFRRQFPGAPLQLLLLGFGRIGSQPKTQDNSCKCGGNSGNQSLHRYSLSPLFRLIYAFILPVLCGFMRKNLQFSYLLFPAGVPNERFFARWGGYSLFPASFKPLHTSTGPVDLKFRGYAHFVA